MKKYLLLLVSLLLLNSCVTKKDGRTSKVIVVIDDYNIESNLADTGFTNFITPKLLDCKEKPINLQVSPIIYRFSGDVIDTLKMEYEKNSVQKFFEIPVKEEDVLNQLKKVELPELWKKNKFVNAKSNILLFASEINEDDIIFADKSYEFLSSFKNVNIVKSEETYRTILSKLFCNSKILKPKIYIFYNLKSFTSKKPITVGGDGGNDLTTTNPCKTTTISSGLDLKEDLVEIIDTKRSTSERIHLAEQVWNKYFDNDAYVAKYLHENDKNSEIWEQGEAKEYFTSRLAIMKSIYDVNIFRIEYSKEDPTKISGIHIVECHNASQKK